MSEFQISKTDFAKHRIVGAQLRVLATATAIEEGEILVKIDRFAITANNITYAVLGDKMGYWQFFPVAEDALNWGVLPVWGFADVVQSKTDGVAVGERLFGYFPPAATLKMCPVRATANRFFDGALHRAALPPGYNSYSRVLAEVGYDRAFDNVRMLLWPLHMTSFCLGDLLHSRSYFDAKQVVILSASSKTSIGLAYALQGDTAAPPTVAVTSAKNSAFVRQLGIYNKTLSYAQIDQIEANLPTVVIDLSGNGEVLARLKAHLGSNMHRCINVGLTHWAHLDGVTPQSTTEQDRSEFFFAPAHIQMRMKDWGVEEFTARTSRFLKMSATKSVALYTFTKLNGLTGLAQVYGDVCAGHIPPEQGLIIQM